MMCDCGHESDDFTLAVPGTRLVSTCRDCEGLQLDFGREYAPGHAYVPEILDEALPIVSGFFEEP